MAAVGVTVFLVYAVLAFASYHLLASLLRGLTRTELLTTAVLVVGLTLALGYLSYRYGTARMLDALDARLLPPERAPALYDRLGELADRVGVEAPTVAVARMEMPNALAVGGARDGVIVLDGRLFRLLSGPELEGILAHELVHLASRDSLVQTLAYSLARTLVGVLMVLLFPIALLLDGLSKGLAWLRGRPTEGSPGVDLLRATVGRAVLSVLVVLTLLVRAHSRRREFAADERAAEVTGRPLALARALRTIERASHPAGGLLATLYVHAEESDPLSRMLSTHPPMDERVGRLVEMAETREGGRGTRVPVGTGR
jgi:heat shock protein HtpX